MSELRTNRHALNSVMRAWTRSHDREWAILWDVLGMDTAHIVAEALARDWVTRQSDRHLLGLGGLGHRSLARIRSGDY